MLILVFEELQLLLPPSVVGLLDLLETLLLDVDFVFQVDFLI